MSVNIKRNGTLQKVAGHTILLNANASEIRQGTVHMTVPSGTNYHAGTVVFSSPMPDDDYTIVLENTGVSGGQGELFNPINCVQSKTTTGFRIVSWVNAGGSIVPDTFVDYRYYAFKLINIEGYTELQNKINNPDIEPTEGSTNLVESGGVWEAIKNASSVFVGTRDEWDAKEDKSSYDLAVIKDETTIMSVDKETGTSAAVANLNKIFKGTQEEWDALTTDEKNEYDIAEIAESSSQGNTLVVDKAEVGNMNPISSNAVGLLQDNIALNTAVFSVSASPSGRSFSTGNNILGSFSVDPGLYIFEYYVYGYYAWAGIGIDTSDSRNYCEIRNNTTNGGDSNYYGERSQVINVTAKTTFYVKLYRTAAGSQPFYGSWVHTTRIK